MRGEAGVDALAERRSIKSNCIYRASKIGRKKEESSATRAENSHVIIIKRLLLNPLLSLSFCARTELRHQRLRSAVPRYRTGGDKPVRKLSILKGDLDPGRQDSSGSPRGLVRDASPRSSRRSIFFFALFSFSSGEPLGDNYFTRSARFSRTAKLTDRVTFAEIEGEVCLLGDDRLLVLEGRYFLQGNNFIVRAKN